MIVSFPRDFPFAAAVVDEDPLEVSDGEEVLLGGVAALLRLLRRVESAAKGFYTQVQGFLANVTPLGLDKSVI